MRRVLILVALVAAIAPARLNAQTPAPPGEAVYKQHCAACHEGSLPRMPTRDALRKMSPEAIETELSSFTMRRQAAALNPAERRAVAAYLTGRSLESYRAPLEAIGKQAYCSTAAARCRGTRSPTRRRSWGSCASSSSRTVPAAARSCSHG